VDGQPPDVARCQLDLARVDAGSKAEPLPAIKRTPTSWSFQRASMARMEFRALRAKLPATRSALLDCQ